MTVDSADFQETRSNAPSATSPGSACFPQRRARAADAGAPRFNEILGEGMYAVGRRVSLEREQFARCFGILAKARNAADVSQDELAFRTSTHRTAISQIERGRHCRASTRR